ncbi:hypothetical protein [Bradyrhizobium sp. P5_C11_2]
MLLLAVSHDRETAGLVPSDTEQVMVGQQTQQDHALICKSVPTAGR